MDIAGARSRIANGAMRLLRASLPVLGVLAVLASVVMGVMLLVFLTVNSDFYAAGPEQRLFPGAKSESPLEVTVRLTGLNEATNTVQISVSATAQKPLSDLIQSGDQSLKINLFSRVGSWGQEIATVDFTKSTAEKVLLDELASQSATGNMLVFRDVNPYPLDDYAQQLAIEVRGKTGDFIIYDTRLVKMIAGRRLVCKGDYNLIDFELKRPFPQKIFVFCSAIVFVLIVLGIALILIFSPVSQTPQSLLLTVAGFLLGAAGFRDLMGLSKLTSFGTGDALVVGIPLLILAGAFIRVAFAKYLRSSGEVRSTMEEEP